MSRNFDLLQRDIAGPNPPPPPKPGPQKTDSRVARDRHLLADDEVMKLVRQVFILPGAAQAPEAVAFCGVYSGDGCSWVCAHAAEMLADHGEGSVCIVDANLRTPSLHDYFRFENGKGFADGVKDDGRPIREYARRASGRHLWLITAGTVGHEPNGSLNPARLRARIAELRDEFDHVLIDTPPIHSYGDAILLSQLTDGVVLVVGSNSTRREPARIAKESFDAAKIPILGAVLNKRTFPIPEALYRKL
jgi:Mrp family chromosome partitioning ATPase